MTSPCGTEPCRNNKTGRSPNPALRDLSWVSSQSELQFAQPILSKARREAIPALNAPIEKLEAASLKIRAKKGTPQLSRSQW